MQPTLRSQLNTNSYREEIDGLRAIAVVAVVLGHFFPSSINQGFLGVDVFFVISGYVITKSLVNLNRSKPVEFMLNFYVRRIRRILPALYFTVLFTFFFTFLVMSRVDGFISNTGNLSLLGLSNLYLWYISSDYFGLAASQNPFTQTWSLSVEAQFYAIYPFLFFFAIKFSSFIKKSRMLLGLIFILSLTFSLLMTVIDMDFTFYSMPTRFWQLFLGSITFYLSKHFDPISKSATNYRTIALILMLIPFFTKLIELFPSQIMVTVATAFFLFFKRNDYLSHILTTRIITWLGVRSYSLYLIHWPVLVLSNYLFGSTNIKNLLCLPVILLLSSACYKFIEVPFRHGAKYKFERVKTITFTVSLVLFTVTFLGYIAPRLSQSENIILPSIFKVSELPNTFTSTCSGGNNFKKSQQPILKCLGGSSESPNRFIFVIGDSHADHLLPMVNFTFNDSNDEIRNLNLGNGADFPFSEIHSNELSPSLNFVSNNSKSGDLVILSFHRGYLNQSRDQHVGLNETIRISKKTVNLIHNLNKFASSMNDIGVKVILVKDTPLMKSVQTSQSCVLQSKLIGNNGCVVTREQDLHTRFLQDYAFDLVASKNQNVTTFDPFIYIYADTNKFDVINDKGFYTMQDWNHITQKLSIELSPSFKSKVRDFLIKAHE